LIRNEEQGDEQTILREKKSITQLILHAVHSLVVTETLLEVADDGDLRKSYD
jgi:hypothetical protein